MTPPPVVAALGPGTWQVDIDGRRELVYVTQSATERWAFCRGLVFVVPLTPKAEAATTPRARAIQTALRAPMPARILKVVTAPGARVKAGDTLIIVEAMKMELPLRADADATVATVHGREGQLVSPDTVLVEFDGEHDA